jgi:Fur family ferric uptake transcriptional regulator
MIFQELAKEAIRANGGRVTPQRELLLNVLADAETDVDAETLHQLASVQDAHISLPTVYRILNMLEQAGVVSSRYLSSQHERKVYRVPVRDDAGTFHFTCSRCGQTLPFNPDFVQQIKTQLATQTGADVQTLCMCAGGLCADCQKG